MMFNMGFGKRNDTYPETMDKIKQRETNMVQCPKCGNSFQSDEDYHYESPEWLNLRAFDSNAFYAELESRIKQQQAEIQEFTKKQHDKLHMNAEEMKEFQLLQAKIKKKTALKSRMKTLSNRKKRELANGNVEGFLSSDEEWNDTLNEYYDV